jgi:hypothetical protein
VAGEETAIIDAEARSAHLAMTGGSPETLQQRARRAPVGVWPESAGRAPPRAVEHPTGWGGGVFAWEISPVPSATIGAP